MTLYEYLHFCFTLNVLAVCVPVPLKIVNINGSIIKLKFVDRSFPFFYEVWLMSVRSGWVFHRWMGFSLHLTSIDG